MIICDHFLFLYFFLCSVNATFFISAFILNVFNYLFLSFFQTFLQISLVCVLLLLLLLLLLLIVNGVVVVAAAAIVVEPLLSYGGPSVGL